MIREEIGLTLDKADKEVLGHAAKVVLTKDTTTIVGDGSTQEAVNKRVAQIKNLIEVHPFYIDLPITWNLIRFFYFFTDTIFSEQVADQDYEKEKLNERIAKLSGGVAVIQVLFI